MPSLALTGGTNKFTWKINSLSGAFKQGNYKSAGITMYQFTVGGVTSISGIVDSVTAPSSGTSTSVSHSVTYSPGTYTFWAFAQTTDGKYWPAGSATVTVSGSGGGSTTPTKDPPTAYGSITVTNVTESSISLRLDSIAKATSYVVTYRRSSETATQQITTTSLYVTLNGLQANTTYIINYYGKNSDGAGPYMPSGGISQKTSAIRPGNWYWSTTVASGYDIKLTATEWNNFCSRVNEFREYKGLAQYGSFSYVTSGTVISAAIVNHAVWAIAAMHKGTTQTQVYNLAVASGDPISASFFNNLKDYLNSL